MREPFAYACEAYACIAREASGPRAREALAAQFAARAAVADARVDVAELVDIVRDAARPQRLATHLRPLPPGALTDAAPPGLGLVEGEPARGREHHGAELSRSRER